MCRAERGKPAAYIKWSHSRNSSSVETLERDGFITVESRLELEEGMDTENLTCAVRHTLWEQERILVPEHEEGQAAAERNMAQEEEEEKEFRSNKFKLLLDH